MFARVRRPSPALVVALLALVVAMAGGALAAIPGKDGVVHACYSKNGGRLRVVDPGKRGPAGKCRKDERALALDQPLPRGAQGPQGPAGTTGPAGAGGAQGIAGRSALTPLQPGESESGTWGMTNYAPSGTEPFVSAQTFPIALSAPLAGDHAVYVAAGTSTTHCPGVGRADGGYLCVYEAGLSDVVPNYVPPIQRANVGEFASAANAGTERSGFLVVLASKEQGVLSGWGTWTVSG